MKKKRFQHSICLTSPTAVELCFSSVEDMPEAKGSVAFITDSAKVFKDDIDITASLQSTMKVPMQFSRSCSCAPEDILACFNSKAQF